MLQRICILTCVLTLIAMTASAQTPPAGSGPYPAIMEGEPGVPGHTVYRPENLSAFSRQNPLPVVAWGNGGCANSNQFYIPFLTEIASHGFLVVAIGPYSAPGAKPADGGMAGGQGGGTKSAQLLEALDWATAENQRSGGKYYGKVDPSKFGVFGHSCGGLQSLEVAPDPRVSTILVMNSGLFGPGGAPKVGTPKVGPPPQAGAKQPGAPPAGGPQGKTPPAGIMMSMPAVGKEVLEKLHSPVIYINGGEKDIAYPQGVDDFAKISKVPVALANLDVGHGGTYSQPNGGEFGKVAVAWLKWTLKKDETAGKMFSGPSCGLCSDSKWKFEKKQMP
jgi:hypothetical protein